MSRAYRCSQPKPERERRRRHLSGHHHAMHGNRWRRVQRGAEAFFRLPGSRRFVVLLVTLVVAVAVGAMILDLRYRGPDGTGLSTPEAIYTAVSQLFFSSPYPLPTDLASRLVYFVVPPIGLVVLGQVLVRLGGAVVNRERWEMALASTYSDHVIVCGLGRVGFRVVQWLRDLGEEVVVIDLPEEDSLHDQVRAWGVPIVVADARRPEILLQAGLMKASAILPLTDDDLVNLSVATGARSLRPDVRVVLRTFDDRLAANLQSGFDIYRAYSTSALAAPAFAAAAIHAPVDFAFAYGEADAPRTLITITKFTIVERSRLCDYTVARLEAEFPVAVIAHRRETFEMHPPGDTVLRAGDGVVVSATPEGLDRLARLTPPTREMRRYLDGRWPIEDGVSSQ